MVSRLTCRQASGAGPSGAAARITCQSSAEPRRRRVPPSLLGRTLAGGLGGSPSRRVPVVLPSHRISICGPPLGRQSHSGGMGGPRGREDGEWTRAFCVHGAGRARRRGTNAGLPSDLGEWRQVTRWSGVPTGGLLSFPASGGTPGRAGRSVLPGTRATCGASRRSFCFPRCRRE